MGRKSSICVTSWWNVLLLTILYFISDIRPKVRIDLCVSHRISDQFRFRMPTHYRVNRFKILGMPELVLNMVSHFEIFIIHHLIFLEI